MEASKSVGANSKALVLGGLALVLTLGTGLVYGRYTQRWGTPPDLAGAGRKLAEFPARVGPWQLVEDKPMSPRIVETLQCSGHFNRTYVHQQTGQSINVAVIVGPAGPTSVHTPEICYSSADYQMTARPERVVLRQPDGDAFWAMTFDAKEPGAEQLRVYYAWSSGGPWKASSHPRFEFGGRPMLFKIQLAGLTSPGDQESSDPCRDFLESLLKTSWRLPVAA